MRPEYFSSDDLRDLYSRSFEFNEAPNIAVSQLGYSTEVYADLLAAAKPESFAGGYSPLPAISRLKEMWKRRKAIELATSLYKEASAGEVDLNAIAENLSRVEMAGSGGYNDRPSEVHAAVLRGAQYGMGDEERIAFGYDKLDRVLRGLRRTDFIVIGGMPNTGKSPFGLTLCYRRAKLRYGHQLIFSLEMSKEQVVQALVCMVTGLPIDALTHGIDSSRRDEWLPLVEKGIEWVDENFSIIDPSIGRMTIGLARAIVNRKRAELASRGKSLDCVFLDYLQLCGSDNKEITNWTRFIKTFALEIEVPWITASSLNRDFARRATANMAEGEVYTRPSMSDLRESGNVEFDATKILFILHRYSGGGIVNDRRFIFCLKNKFGPAFVAVEYEFEAKRLKFSEVE